MRQSFILKLKKRFFLNPVEKWARVEPVSPLSYGPKEEPVQNENLRQTAKKNGRKAVEIQFC